MKPNTKRLINEIATELAFNYYSVSKILLGADESKGGKQLRLPLDSIFDKKAIHEFQDKGPVRNILIIGAGASFDSDSHFELGNDVKKKLLSAIKSIIQKFDPENPDQTNENKLLELLYKSKRSEIAMLKFADLENLDFEGALSHLADVVGDTYIRDALKDHYTMKRYVHSLSYEIIAHLFKHGFIDVIINFNFDEILGEKLQEELGVNNYHSIFSEGDVLPLGDLMINDRLKKPIYIKPHGTASHPNSIRFTKNQYFDISKEITNLIKDLFSFEIPKKSSKQSLTHGQTNVISIGFNMQSIEFHSIFQAMPEGSKIFAIGKTPPDGLKFREVQNESSRKINSLYHTTHNQPRFIPIDDFTNINLHHTTPVGNILIELFQKIQTKFSKYNYPKSIHRHLAINAFLWNFNENYNVELENQSEKSKKEKNSIQILTLQYQYLEFKIYFEIAVAIARNNGIIDLSDTMNGRLGSYFEKYLNHPMHKNKKTNLYDFSDKLGLKPLYETNESIQIFTWNEEDHQKAISYLTESSSNINEVTLGKNSKSNAVLCHKFFSIVEKINSAIFDKCLSDNITIQQFMDHFEHIWSSDSSVLRPNFSDYSNYLFASPDNIDILHTNLSLIIRFRALLESEEWDTLLLISDGLKLLENGFLNAKIKTKGQKVIALGSFEESFMRYVKKQNFSGEIKQDEFNPKFLHKQLTETELKFMKEGENQLLFLPYWQHNNHMAIFLNTKEGPKKINTTGMIYFYKRGLSSYINPIFLSKSIHRNQLMVFLKNFHSHWLKARDFQNDIKKIKVMPPNPIIFNENKNSEENKDSFSYFLKEIIRGE